MRASMIGHRGYESWQFGVALHNGPLHKDPVRCHLYSDCGYGTRFLPRFGLEVGYRISPDASVSLFYTSPAYRQKKRRD